MASMTVAVMRSFFCAFILATGVAQAEPPVETNTPVSAWGVDGCLTRHVTSDENFSAYVRLLQDSGVRWVRERQVWQGGVSGDISDEKVMARYRAMHAAGLRVAAFAGGPPSVTPQQPGNQLPEDLQAVYAGAFRQGREFAGLVDAWEITGEPDVGYCRDLPDRLVAYNKAMYLGLHDGAASVGKPVIVLMGALALPPGPWLQRAVRNGLLDYTDAYNFHFYGHAADLAGVIAAHRAMVREVFPPSGIEARHGRPGVGQPPRPPELILPLWITECGINAVTRGDFFNPARRALQAEFTVQTARQARAARDVTVFMPFILVHEDDPHALTLSPSALLPAWQAYAATTREHRWPARPLVRGTITHNPVVMQWMPDNATTVPHKVSGTYRFRSDQPITGVVRVYNFGDQPVQGRIEGGTEGRTAGLLDSRISGLPAAGFACTVPAGGRVDVPVTFLPSSPDYFREDWFAEFIDDAGRRSPVFFGLERDPRQTAFTVNPLTLTPCKEDAVRFPICEGSLLGETSGPWTTLNGLKVSESADGEGTTFWVEKVNDDPLAPTQAAASVAGLPKEGFLRLQLSRIMSRECSVRVDLVDGAGRRFTIWENLGMSYQQPSSPDVWLNLADFHPYFWGRAGERVQFRPSQTREVQLRFYFKKPNDPVEVRLSIMTAAAACGARTEAGGPEDG